MTIRVLVADDQSIVRAGLATILDGQPDMEVVGQAADGRQAVALARELRPDVCLLDIRMPNLDGIKATRLLAGPDVEEPTAVVVITTFDTDEYVHGALKAGARGFLLKGAAGWSTAPMPPLIAAPALGRSAAPRGQRGCDDPGRGPMNSESSLGPSFIPFVRRGGRCDGHFPGHPPRFAMRIGRTPGETP